MFGAPRENVSPGPAVALEGHASWLDLLAHWSVRQKLNRVSSVQLRRSVRAFN